MKRCIFHVPSNEVNVICVEAPTEAAAWQKLADTGGERLYTFKGTTKDNKPELITCIEIAPRKRSNKGEKDNE